MSVEIATVQDTQALNIALENAVNVVERGYLQRLDALQIVSPNSETLDIDAAKCGRFYRLTHLVYDKDARFLDKLMTVVNIAFSLDSTLATLVHSDGREVFYCFGVLSKNHRTDSRQDRAFRLAAEQAFSGALEGNFAGSKLRQLSPDEVKDIQRELLDAQNLKAISAVSGIVSLRGGNTDETRRYVQGLENLTDALRWKNYTILMVADPVSTEELREIKRGYEMIYTQLSAFHNIVLTVNESSNITMSSAQTKGITKGITEGISMTQSTGKNRAFTMGANASVSFEPLGVGASVGVNASFTNGVSTSETWGSSSSKTEQSMWQATDSIARALGTGRSIQTTAENRTVKTLLEKIDQYIQRLELCGSYGAFNCAAYVLSGSLENTLSAASSYNALMRGEQSALQSSHISTWQPDAEGKENFRLLARCLQAFVHPRFYLDATREIQVTPASLLSGRELAVQFGLPQKSIPGLTVNEMAAFGRNVRPAKGQSVELGRLYHMGQEESASLPLDVDSLTAHLFVTGSTGSGKSNTIYHLLRELCLQEGSRTKFLVIEPAKGEYKQVFGGYGGVSVYGTNPQKTPLLRLNPFSFPEDTHVLEHIDRLVEIFNACWPMHAAMPAILKDAIERSYTACGWDLARSTCAGNRRFPTFAVLLRELPAILTQSAYSADTKGDYTGALVTRVKSLTNGINGQIFCQGTELEDAALFEENVIVDLSRVGSVETKALLMGIFMIKLQEYRMASAGEMNEGLRHITVLEEAHALLRRTSPEQSQDSANLQGRSVEMLSSAIAEMRTYGEGFVISDQAPGLLDPSVIRNTNTKIILRLPDSSDRLLVGQAAGLNDRQIQELAKLEMGVAAVYQNNWIEPVLCQVTEFREGRPFRFTPPRRTVSSLMEKLFQGLLYGLESAPPFTPEETEHLWDWLSRLDTGTETKRLLRQAITAGEALPVESRGKTLYYMIKGKALWEQVRHMPDPAAGRDFIFVQIADMLHISDELAREVQRQAFNYAAEHVKDRPALYQECLQYGGIL